jgi:tRNA (guanine37-N1)-methyltransferase
MKKAMRFDILTIFPGMFDCYLNESMIKRAQARKLLDIRIHDLRDWATTKHRQVDDRLFGGGPGMLLKVEPIHRALKSIKAEKAYVVLMSPRGTKFTHAVSKRLSKHKRIVFICGRYEGVDQRVTDHLVDEEISIGDYVLTGGELPAMVVLDSVSRFVPGVVGKEASIVEESHSKEGYLEYPQYTRPEEYVAGKGKKWVVPKVLLSGNHKDIAAWRDTMSGKAK